jgi:S1-C subfamily serine protease
MSVPVDLLRPILHELVSYGRTLKPARPWLGMFVSEAQDRLLVAGVYNGAPAAAAELRAGDVVLAVGGTAVAGLATLFREVWAHGSAGAEIPLLVERDGRTFEVRVHSVDRRDFWRAPDLH